MAYAYNPIYSAGRDQQDCGWKPVWVNSLGDPFSKKTLHKNMAGRVAEGEGLEFKL
jgi:hypothetical protein